MSSKWLPYISTVEEVEALEPADPTQLAYVTQTTLSLDDTREVIEALNERFPEISGPSLNDICYATQNRQNAVRELVEGVDLLLVVGSQNSSNSNRLRELGEREGVPSYLIDHPDEIQSEWLVDKRSIGVTAGASAPEILVSKIIRHLKGLGVDEVREVEGEAEMVTFRNPPELEALAADRRPE